MLKKLRIGQSAGKLLNIVVITRYEETSTTRRKPYHQVMGNGKLFTDLSKDEDIVYSHVKA